MPAMVFETFLSTPDMARVFDDAAFIQSMLDFEAALARSQAQAGLISHATAAAIASLCRVELFDVDALLLASSESGSLSAPVVRKLTETVALFDPAAAAHVHWGACCQDVIDSAMVLQTRRALALIETDLMQLVGQLLELAQAQEAVPMLARAKLQPVQVSSLRFKLVGWVLPLLRSVEALRNQADEALRLQLGGAAGTLSAMGRAADEVSRHLAQDLRLSLSDMPWHTQRDRWVRLGAELGVLCGALGKVATDLTLLTQAEVGELGLAPIVIQGLPTVSDGLRHPLAPVPSLVAARRAPQRVAALLACMGQEHERGIGSWHAELPEWAALLLCTHGSVKALAGAVSQVRPQPARMRQHIEQTQDLVFAENLLSLLSRVQGRALAQKTVAALVARVQQGEGRLGELAQRWLQDGTRGEHGGGIGAGAVAGLNARELAALFDLEAAARWADERCRTGLQQAVRQWETLLASPRPGG